MSSDDCHKEATDCLDRAEAARDPFIRAEWMRLAEAWLNSARHRLDQQLAEAETSPTQH
jgi:hypothetical protein